MQYWHNLELVVAADHPELVDEIQLYCETNKIKLVIDLVPVNYNRRQKFMQCVSRCKGRYIGILDSDDELGGGALQVVHECLKLYPQHKYFTTAHTEIDIDGNYLANRGNDPQELTLAALENGFRQRHFWGFKLDEMPYLAPALDHHYVVEDYHFFAMCAVRGYYPLCIPFNLYSYRRHSVQITHVESETIAAMITSIRLSVARFADNSAPLVHMKSAQMAIQAAAEQEHMLKMIDPTHVVF